MADISRCVRDYYLQLWGEPSRTAEFQKSAARIEVYKWDAEVHPEEVAFYITNGLSDHELPAWSSKHRLEFFVGFLPEEDRVVEALASLAVSPVVNGIEIGDKHTMTFSEPLWEGSEMYSVMISRQMQNIVPTLWLDEGIHVEFMEVMPLFPTELELKKEQGGEAMLSFWREQKLPFWDPNRDPMLLADVHPMSKRSDPAKP